MTIAAARTRATAASHAVGSTTVAAIAAVTSALLLVAVLAMPVPAGAADPLTLGRAGTFSVLANTSIDNGGVTVLSESLGLSPGTSVTGTPLVVNGETHLTDTDAANAQTDLGLAYSDAATLSGGTDIGAALTTQTLSPGVYKATSALGMSGALTLDAQGDPTAQFIFQVGTALTVDAVTQVVMINRAQACNVFWEVGSAATIGAGTTFKGTIMASAAVGLGAGAALEGRALSTGANVVLANNNITQPSCDMTVPDPPTDPTTPTDPATDPTTNPTDPTTNPTDPTTDPATDPTTEVSTVTSPVRTSATSSRTATSVRSGPGAGDGGAGGAGGAGAGGVDASRSAAAAAQATTLASTGVSPMLRSLLILGALLPVLGAGLLIAVRRSRVRAAASPETALAHSERRWRCR